MIDAQQFRLSIGGFQSKQIGKRFVNECHPCHHDGSGVSLFDFICFIVKMILIATMLYPALGDNMSRENYVVK